jgi:mannose-6-phosphate isomerase-like protein (cupin superfamily)
LSAQENRRTPASRHFVLEICHDQAMATLISSPQRIEAVGTPPKTISEFVGNVSTGTSAASVAVMDSPHGWSEPGQTPEFDEYSLVLEGELSAETRGGTVVAGVGQAILASGGEWVRYSTPGPSGARYVSVCVPAFSPETVHRDG